MNNFVFSLPTKVYFGIGQLRYLHDEACAYGKKVLLVYGGGSIKRSGLYSEIRSILNDCSITELGGVEPNPKISTVSKGAELCRKNDVDLILAVGGGSAIDCSKLTAAAAYYPGDPWDLVVDPSKITRALPIVCITTIAATGSETDCAAVISNPEVRLKLVTGHPALTPRCAFMDPTRTFSVPAKQTSAGAADIMSHAMENYFALPESAFIPDSFAEGVIRAVIKYAPIALRQPDNYEARAQLMWASSMAINGICDTGKLHNWSCHPIEHELSAYYDLTHGIGLAIISPKWMRHILSEATLPKFVSFAVNVWGLDPSKPHMTLAAEAIDATESFFKSLGLPSTLSEVGIGDENFRAMSRGAVANNPLGAAYVPLNEDDVYHILEMCK